MSDLGIVVNNKAKNAESFTVYTQALTTHGLNYSLYQGEPDTIDELLRAARKKHSILLVGGGDGTIRSAAQYCVNTATILGILPLGTLNHFAQELGLPTDPMQLVNAIKHNRVVSIDVAQVNDKVFLNNSSIGFYPHFAKQRNYYNRFYNKWLSYIPGFIQALRYHPAVALAVSSEKFTYDFTTSFLMVSNNVYTYEFPIKFVRDNFNQAKLGIYFFKHGRLKVIKLIRYFFNRKRSFVFKKISEPIKITIAGLQEISVSMDGEVMSMHTPLHYSSIPHALNILISAP